MAVFKRPDEIIHFPNNMSIELNYKNMQVYSKCRNFDMKVMNQGFVWHQVVVQHKGKVSNPEGRRDILEAIFEAIEGEEFYPIAYRNGVQEDKFLVRQCTPAFEKLFSKNLRIQLSKGAFVPLQVQLNVGEFKFGQISPITKLEEALGSLFEHLDLVNGQYGILNLSKFGLNRQLVDVVVYLGNRGVLERICEAIYRNNNFRKVNGLILSDNNITTLAPLKVFNGVDFALLDLRENQINSATRLCRELKGIQADELLLAGNPILKLSTYPNSLEPIIKNFKLIDGIPIENLSKDYTPMDHDVDVDCDGFRIDWTNKAELQKFQSSYDWHAVMIPDPEQEFSKEEIFDFFFTSTSTELSDIYPCYYKHGMGEHQFLVRNCFDQLQHLVEFCNLEIKIPRLAPAPVFDADDITDINMLPQVQIEKTLNYYLRMNISVFKKGQIEPMYCIEKALNRRYSAMDRLLNLDSFHAIEGLENIIINLSSPRILSRVLMQASRKYLNNCVELCLSNNKILNANFPKVLALMANLKAIDLGNNWILDLNDIKDLDKLGLKSLRLDGNPLCAKYSFAGEYINAVKKHFPDLQKLDNVDITAKGNLSTQKNFLCDVKGYDFVEQFVTHYFQTFSSPERAKLLEMYHPNALFSMTCNYVAMSAHGIKRLSKYKEQSRNILRMPDFARAFTTVHAGINEISQVLMLLPKMDFDMLSFATDTTAYNEKMIVITVHGVVMDRAPTIVDSDILMGFTRTFVLTSVERKLGILKCAASYKIVNEQFNVFSPTNAQTKLAFKYSKPEDNKKADDMTVADKEALLIMLQEITSLKSIWCTRCLEDAKWDFESSLAIFMNLCQKNEIPDTAFI